MIPSPRDGERETNADEAQTCDIQLNDYNRRFSGEPRPVRHLCTLGARAHAITLTCRDTLA
ncbi:unnamed protein product [Anisakis simplex]|uniref:Uncharacterized protein n=1 Tax=Anisakis simplex TaxID=6269 RepID=A0A3P6PJI3_ANISI|nr:unnamed protein product [Anisakis simplex]